MILETVETPNFPKIQGYGESIESMINLNQGLVIPSEDAAFSHSEKYRGCANRRRAGGAGGAGSPQGETSRRRA